VFSRSPEVVCECVERQEMVLSVGAFKVRCQVEVLRLQHAGHSTSIPNHAQASASAPAQVMILAAHTARMFLAWPP